MQAVFQVAQKGVGLQQLADRFRFQQAQFGQHGVGFAGAAQLQAAFAAAADQLEHLGDEFHLADAARPQLDVFRHVAARHLAADLRVQLAHGAVGTVIHVLAVHEGAHQLRQVAVVAGHHPRLDPGVAFPLAALGDEVVLQHVEAAHQRTRVAVGAQAHVDAEHLAVLGDLVQGLDELLAQAFEELVVADHLLAAGVAVLGVDEDQVDVRRHVEFATAELAHPDHEQLLLPAGRRQRLAVALDQRGTQHVVGMADRDLGEYRHGLGDFGQRGVAGEVAHDQVAQHPDAQLPQGRAQRAVTTAEHDFARSEEALHVDLADRLADAFGKRRTQPGLAVQHA